MKTSFAFQKFGV